MKDKWASILYWRRAEKQEESEKRPVIRILQVYIRTFRRKSRLMVGWMICGSLVYSAQRPFFICEAKVCYDKWSSINPSPDLQTFTLSGLQTGFYVLTTGEETTRFHFRHHLIIPVTHRCPPTLTVHAFCWQIYKILRNLPKKVTVSLLKFLSLYWST